MKQRMMLVLIGLLISGQIVLAQDTPTPDGSTQPEVTAVVPAPVQPPTVVVQEPPVVTPDPSPAPSPTDGAGAALVLVLALVGALNRFVELLKPSIKSLGLTDQGYDAAVVAVSVALGVVMVLVSNQQLNLLAGLPLVPPLVGTIITGASAGFGAGAVQAVFDLVMGATGQLPTVSKQSSKGFSEVK